jgi:transposase
MPATLVNFIGIDVSKRSLDCAFSDTDHLPLSNDAAGFRRIIERARALEHPRVVLEASGAYHLALVAALWAARLEVCVVPPGRVRAFAKALGLRAKADRIDAGLLRRYGQQCDPRRWQPPPRERSLLRSWVDARRALIDQRVAWQNRLEGADALMQRIAREQCRLIARQLERIEADIAAHLEQHEQLRRQAQRWQQVCGVGPVTAWTLLAYLPEIEQPDVSENELAALTGLAPDPNESGERARPRHIADGRWQVRCVLHMAARTARRHNPILRAFADRLQSHGKLYKVTVTAVSRKLLLLLRRLAQDPDFSLA